MRRTRTLALLLPLALAPSVGARAQVEPLTVRVSDAEGSPGGPVAVVLRTYASRPVSQGRLGVRAASAAPFARASAGSAPFASFDGGAIFSAGGDVTPVFSWDSLAQAVDSQFSSLSASINTEDGILAVLFFTLAAGVAPGATYDLTLDLGPEFVLTDPEGQPIAWQPRAGRLDIRAAATNRLLGIDAPRVHPGSGADVEIVTLEPFGLDSGVIEVNYPTDVLSLPRSVTRDPRHGSVDFQVTEPQAGRLRIEFSSPGGDFNSVPGPLFVLHLPTRGTVMLGVTRTISIEAATTALFAPGVPDPVPVPVRLASGTLEFDSDPSVFYDNFEGASFGGWSRRVP